MWFAAGIVGGLIAVPQCPVCTWTTSCTTLVTRTPRPPGASCSRVIWPIRRSEEAPLILNQRRQRPSYAIPEAIHNGWPFLFPLSYATD